MTAYSISSQQRVDPVTGAANLPHDPPTYAQSARSNSSTPSLHRAATNMTNNSYTVPAAAAVSGAEKSRKPSRFNQHLHSVSTKVGWPLNKAANLVGGEGWWPTNMDKECSKAARILHSFTKELDDTTPQQPPRSSRPMHPVGISRKSMVKIPDAVLRNCSGLAIFNVLRAGAFHGSLAAGSGVVVARRPDGTWSPPSSFVVSTAGAGFVVGLDIYDCVCVLNSPAQVAAFTHPRVSLGGEASIAVGPLGAGTSVDAALSKTVRPMWSYMKSRGLWAGVQIDGTVIVSRADANSVFYDERGISAKKILTGDVAWPARAKPLFEVLRAIDGHTDFDHSVVQQVAMHPPPGDTVTDEKNAPSYVEVAEKETEEYKEETVMDEKQRLAQSGY